MISLLHQQSMLTGDLLISNAHENKRFKSITWLHSTSAKNHRLFLLI